MHHEETKVMVTTDLDLNEANTYRKNYAQDN